MNSILVLSFRSVGSTGANLESSRSHQVLQIVIRTGPNAEKPIMNDAKARRLGGVVGRPSIAAGGAASNTAGNITGNISQLYLS